VAINISYYDAMDTSLHARIQLRNAYLAAKRSDDRSTKNGVILTTQDMEVIGFNHFTPGFGDKEEHHERPLKYSLVEHAEADAIHAAASLGVNTNGAIMFAPWAPCPDCARAIVGAGIAEVVCHKQCMDRTPERWLDMVRLGLDILKHGSVLLTAFDGEIGGVENLNNGEIWKP
jgi:dCMP deaminase